jgi:hypothetical protein
LGQVEKHQDDTNLQQCHRSDMGGYDPHPFDLSMTATPYYHNGKLDVDHLKLRFRLSLRYLCFDKL